MSLHYWNYRIAGPYNDHNNKSFSSSGHCWRLHSLHCKVSLRIKHSSSFQWIKEWTFCNWVHHSHEAPKMPPSAGGSSRVSGIQEVSTPSNRVTPPTFHGGVVKPVKFSVAVESSVTGWKQEVEKRNVQVSGTHQVAVTVMSTIIVIVHPNTRPVFPCASTGSYTVHDAAGTGLKSSSGKSTISPLSLSVLSKTF